MDNRGAEPAAVQPVERRKLSGTPSVASTMLAVTAAYFGFWFVLFIFFYGQISTFIYNFFGATAHAFFRSFRFPVILGLYLLVLVVVYGYAQLRRERRYRRALIEDLTEQLDLVFQEDGARIALGPELGELGQKLNTLRLENINARQAAALNEQRKNDLVMYLAHDIRTPLTSIIGYLNLLDEADDMPAEQRKKYLGITLEKAYRLENLINEFFDITRFNLQTIVLEKREINLGHMLHQMADEFYPILAAEGKTARVEVSGEVRILADADKLARVLNNVLKNASAYSYSDTEILIRAVQKEGRAVIDVVNRGPTIPPERLDTIFEKFFRLDSARSTTSGGAGLGLAIAREIVDAHGGKIQVRSEEETTVFRISLPAVE